MDSKETFQDEDSTSTWIANSFRAITSSEPAFPEFDDSFEDMKPSLNSPQTHPLSHSERSLERRLAELKYQDQETDQEMCADSTNIPSRTLLMSPLYLNRSNLLSETPTRTRTDISELLSSEPDYSRLIGNERFSPNDESTRDHNILDSPVVNRMHEDLTWKRSNLSDTSERSYRLPQLRSEFSRIPDPISLELTDRELDYLYELCFAMDSNAEEKVTQSSSYNSLDARKAAEAAGLSEPHGATLEALVLIGLTLPDYAESSTPWVSAFEVFSREIRLKKQEQYLEARRRDQERIANQLFMHRAATEYLTRWKVAFHDDIYNPNKILASYDHGKFILRFLRHWRALTSIMQKRELLASSSSDTNLKIDAIANWRASIRLVRSADIFSVDCNDLLVKRKFFRKMRCYLLALEDMHAFSDQSFDRLVLSSMMKKWVQIIRTRSADMLVEKNLLKKAIGRFSKCHNEVHELQSKSVAIQQRRWLKMWRTRSDNLARLTVLQYKIGLSLQQDLMQSVFQRWQRAVKVEKFVVRKNHSLQKESIRHWKMTMLSQVLRLEFDTRSKSLFFHLWYHGLQDMKRLRIRFLQVRELENHAVIRASFGIIRQTYMDIKAQSAHSVPMHNYILLTQGFRNFVTTLRTIADMDECASNYRDRAVARMAFTRLARCSSALRDRRLQAAQRKIEEWIKPRNVRKILLHWKTKTRKQMLAYEYVDRISNTSTQREILGNWKALLLDLNLLDTAADTELRIRTVKRAFDVWYHYMRECNDLTEGAIFDDQLRLAGIFRKIIRHWQYLSAICASQNSEAKRYHDRQIRNSQLTFFQRWRESVSENSGDTVNNMSVTFSRSTTQDSMSSAHRWYSPSKRFPMSPAALQKWMASKEKPPTMGSLDTTPFLPPLSTPTRHESVRRNDEGLDRNSGGTPTRPLSATRSSFKRR